MADIVGSWKYERATGYDEFVKGLGWSPEEIEAWRHIGYLINLSNHGTDWFIRMDLDIGITWLNSAFKMDTPFTYFNTDKKTKLVSLVTLKGDHFHMTMTLHINKVVTKWNIEIYKQDDFLLVVHTKDGKKMTQYLKKVDFDMVGIWRAQPQKTTGWDEFADEMGMSNEEKEMGRNVVFDFDLSRNADVWHMKLDIDKGTTKITWLDTSFTMGVPFSYPHGTSMLTSLITLENNHFIESMTKVQDDVTTHWDVDTYRDGDYIITKQTMNGKTTIQWLKKI